MTSDELVLLLDSNGINNRTRGDEVQLEVCIFCNNDRYNLELNAERGVVHCWNCRRGSRLDLFLRQLLGLDVRIDVNVGEGGHGAPPPDRQVQLNELKLVPAHSVELARRYLEGRGLSIELQRKYEAGICTNQDFPAGSRQPHPLYGRICFPVRDFWEQKYMGVVGRRYVGSDGSKYMNDCSHRIAGFLTNDRAPYVMCEGVFDAIAIHRAGGNAAALLGTNHWEVETWAGRVSSERKIVVCLDGSAWDRALSLYYRISPVHEHTAIVKLPTHLDPGGLEPSVLSALFVLAGPPSPQDTFHWATSKITGTGEV